MSKFFHLSKKPVNSNQTKKRSKKMKINTKILNIMMIGLIVVFGFSYLVQMNGLATKGYQIKDLEVQIEQLELQGSNLELEVLSLQSISNVKNKVSKLNMVEVGNVEYLSPTPVALAR